MHFARMMLVLAAAIYFGKFIAFCWGVVAEIIKNAACLKTFRTFVLGKALGGFVT